jgi:hypothetical protein
MNTALGLILSDMGLADPQNRTFCVFMGYGERCSCHAKLKPLRFVADVHCLVF